jgi:hypothetical protein
VSLRTLSTVLTSHPPDAFNEDLTPQDDALDVRGGVSNIVKAKHDTVKNTISNIH